MRYRVIEPTTEQILAYCAEDPVERVFLEDVARRGHGRFAGLSATTARSRALPSGHERRPSGAGTTFVDLAAGLTAH
jgi:hypothetical protein